MAGGFFDFIDDKLEEAYKYVEPDNTRHRAPFVKALRRTLESFKEGRQPRGDNGMWSAANNVVRFIPKLGATYVPLKADKPVFYVPDTKFPDAIEGLIKEVEAGTHDDALAKAYESRGKGDLLAGGVKLSGHRVERSDKPARAGWSPERRAKYEATQAAKKGGKPA